MLSFACLGGVRVDVAAWLPTFEYLDFGNAEDLPWMFSLDLFFTSKGDEGPTPTSDAERVLIQTPPESGLSMPG